MAIAYRAGSTAGNSGGGNISISKPSGVVDGDILLALTYREDGAWTLPAGWAWVSAEQVNSTGEAWIRVAWKRASSEGSSYTFTKSGSAWRIVTMGAWSGCATSGDPFEAATGYTESLAVVKATSITTTVADTMCVACAASYSGDNIGVSSSGYTQRAELGGCELFEKAKAATGATGTISFGTVSGSDWASVHLALLPAAAASGVDMAAFAAELHARGHANLRR